jgi:hypothetical protein
LIFEILIVSYVSSGSLLVSRVPSFKQNGSNQIKVLQA